MNYKIKLLTAALERQKALHAKLSADIATANKKTEKQIQALGVIASNYLFSQVDDREAGNTESEKTAALLVKQLEQQDKITEAKNEVKAKIDERASVQKEIERIERDIEIEQYPLRMDALFKAANVNTYDELLAFIKSKNNTTASE